MMGGKNAIVRLLSAVALAGALSVAAGTVTTAMAASTVEVVVNSTVITSGDVAKRVAFLKLQRQSGGAAEAKQQLVDEVLKRAEIARVQQSSARTRSMPPLRVSPPVTSFRRSSSARSLTRPASGSTISSSISQSR